MKAVHYLCHAWRRHLAYALLSIRSLILRGSVDSSQIFVTVTENLLDTPEGLALARQGVTIMVIPRGYHQKFIALDHLFRARPDIESIVQLDADTILTGPCDFLNKLGTLTGDANLACYRGSEDGRRVMENRQRLFLKEYDPRGNESRWRLDAMMSATLGFDWAWLQLSVSHWVLGGLFVCREELFNSPAWKAILALSWITHCDETVIQAIRFARLGVDFTLLKQQDFPHRVCPNPLNLSDGAPGMVHYAGDWYREHEPQVRERIELELIRVFGLNLPNDAPVGPRLPRQMKSAVPPGGDSNPLSTTGCPIDPL